MQKTIPYQYLKKLFRLFICCIGYLLVFQHAGFAQQVSEYEAKTAFLIKIPGFIDWPEKFLNQSPNFIISILGDDPIEKTLSNKIQKSGIKLKNKTVQIKRINSAIEAEGSHILFIASSEKYDVSKIVKTTKAFHVLTIGDTEGFAEKGVMINMFVDGSIKFDVNKISAEQSEIYISSKLLAHAINVYK